MLSKLSRSRSPRRHAGLKRFVRSTPKKVRRKSGRFAAISARKSTVPKPPVADRDREKKEEGQGSHHTSPTEAARSHDAQLKHTELTERTSQAAKPKVGYLGTRGECCEHGELRFGITQPMKLGLLSWLGHEKEVVLQYQL